MTPEQLNRAVAERFGWMAGKWIIEPLSSRKGFRVCSIPNAVDWLPSTNLQQAVDLIVPALHKMYWSPSFNVCKEQGGIWCQINQIEELEPQMLECQGQGSTPSERMAWALCEVFVKVRS